VIAFRRVPVGTADVLLRPLLDVYVDAQGTVPQTCLLDTGAAGVRLSAEIARAAGTALPEAPNAPDLIAGGVRSQTYRVQHRLSVELDGAAVSWTAPVSFCDPWPHPFGLLGLAGFFDVFDVLLQGLDRRFDLTRRVVGFPR
jgi:hypothetical protein